MKNLFFLLCFFSCILIVSCTDKEDELQEPERGFDASIDLANLENLPEDSSNRLDRFKVHKSKGSISKDGPVKKFKWDMSYDAETNTVSGPAARYVEKGNGYHSDLDLENVCTCVLDGDEYQAFNVFRISNIRSTNESVMKVGKYFVISTGDGSKLGTEDKTSYYQIYTDRNVKNIMNSLNTSSQCAALIHFSAHKDNLQRPRFKVPSDDWLRVNGVD